MAVVLAPSFPSVVVGKSRWILGSPAFRKAKLHPIQDGSDEEGAKAFVWKWHVAEKSRAAMKHAMVATATRTVDTNARETVSPAQETAVWVSPSSSRCVPWS